MASAVTLISQSIVTTSLPYYMDDFAISSATAQWTYSVFLLVIGVMIPPTAYITKRFKIKTILTTSLILFIIGSLLCFLSTNFEMYQSEILNIYSLDNNEIDNVPIGFFFGLAARQYLNFFGKYLSELV